MELNSPNSKRKRTDGINLGNLLHPGQWRQGKRARTPSPPRSPSLSPAPTPETSCSNYTTQSGQDSRDPSPSRNTPPTATATATHSQNIFDTAAGTSSGSRSAMWTGLEQALQTLSLTTKACPPLRSAIDDLASCLPIFEGVASKRSDQENLAAGLKAMVELLIKHLQYAAPGTITSNITDVVEGVRMELESIRKNQSRGGARRGEASLCTWSISSKHFVNTHLESLRPAKLARYNSEIATDVSRRTCTENTRIGILQNLHHWAEDQGLAKIYWMNGMAGTGKTTIACSLCTELEASKQLAASFFCTRTSPECRDAKRIVPTIAYQLARRSSPFRSALCEILEENADIGTGTISDQFDHILRKPLRKAKDDMPNNLVVVVDALDECDDPYIVELVLGLLFRSVADLPIKFFVTSRPEPAIRQRMMAESERSRSILYLHEIEKSLVQADIEIYLKDELGPMRPSGHAVRRLAEQAGNLFIYAATAIRYIRPPGKSIDSQERLEALLSANIKPNRGLLPIDKLYSIILTTAVHDEELEPQERERILLVLWTVVCAREPVLINTIALISGLGTKGKVTASLESLRSVLHVSEHNDLVTTLHASFAEYILTQNRSGQFACNVPMHNLLLAERCLKIMEAQLRFNICHLPSSFVPDDEIPDLKERIGSNISAELFYACRFWMDHLNLAVFLVRHPILPRLNDFLSQRLLFWMEVLNVTKCMFIGVVSTSRLISWLQREHDGDPELNKLASDVQCFVVGYASRPISNYTPHIYLSALPFYPSFSHYLPRFKGLVTVSGDILNGINTAALGTWELESPVLSAAFLPKGEHIVYGNEGGELCVQSAHDGKNVVRPFKAHEKPITCVAVSRDGAQIVTGSDDMTLSVWGAQSGALISGPFQGHLAGITSVAFSPDGAHLASGSADSAIGVWTSKDAAIPMRLLLGHRERINSVEFSPDGARCVSSSSDCTIRLWDVIQGVSILISETHARPVMSAQFSSDGSTIISFSQIRNIGASGSHQGHLRFWDTSDMSLRNEKLINNTSDHITTIAISPSGDFLAGSTYYSSAIRTWNVDANTPPADSCSGHTAAIRSLSFSNDGTRIISASNDNTVRIWNVHGTTLRPERPPYNWGPTSKAVALAPDQICVAFANLDLITPTIHIFNPSQKTPTSIGVTHFGLIQVKLVQLSVDGTQVFLISDSGKIGTWDVLTGKLADGPYPCTMSDSFESIACSTDGTRVVTNYGFGAIVEIWDIDSNRAYSSQVITTGSPDELHHRVILPIFSRRGGRFLTNNTDQEGEYMRLWDMDRGTQIAGPYRDVRGLGLSPNGSHVICRIQDEVRLLDVGNESMWQLPFVGAMTRDHALIFISEFSPDGVYLVYTADTQCCIWNVRDHVLVDTLDFPGTIAPLGSLSFNSITYSSNGRLMFTDRNYTRVQWFHIEGPRYSISPDGWVVDSQSHPLLWIPAEIRNDFPTYSKMVVNDGYLLYVNYDNMLVGNDWGKCYISDLS